MNKHNAAIVAGGRSPVARAGKDFQGLEHLNLVPNAVLSSPPQREIRPVAGMAD